VKKYIILSNLAVFDSDNLRREINTYKLQNKYFLNRIYERAKEVIEEYEKQTGLKLHNFNEIDEQQNESDDSLQYEKDLEGIEDIDVYNRIKRIKYSNEVFSDLDMVLTEKRYVFNNKFNHYNIESNKEEYKYIEEFTIITFIYYALYVIEYIDKIRGQLKEKEFENKTPLKELTFKDLFSVTHSSDKKINELKELLKNNGFINNDYKWIGTTKYHNELAHLFYYLKDKKIIKVDNTNIKVFYNEFGLKVDSKKTTDSYCTLRVLEKRPQEKDITDIFKLKFSNWIK